jgi:hypothetical protein
LIFLSVKEIQTWRDVQPYVPHCSCWLLNYRSEAKLRLTPSTLVLRLNTFSVWLPRLIFCQIVRNS